MGKKLWLMLAVLLASQSQAQIRHTSPTNADPRLRINLYSDMPGGSASGRNAPYVVNLLASALADVGGEKEHPGIYIANSSVNANSGHLVWTAQQNEILLSGSEHFVFIFKQARFTDVVHLSGFLDVITASTPVDGVFFSVSAAGAITGVTSNNSASSVTATSYTLTLGTWYRGELFLNPAATLATFYLYDCATGFLLWTDTLATNIPTAAGRETGIGWLVYHTGTEVLELASLDFIQAEIQRDLVR